MEEEERRENIRDSIGELGSSILQTERGTICVLTIAGQIEGHRLLPAGVKSTKYEHILPLLVSVEESESIDGLLILLNTGGGEVEAGLAIAELIASMKKPTVSLVLGGSHSIGVPLAVAAQKSLIAPSAAMTLHPVRLEGMVVGAPQTYRYFQRVQERILSFIERNSAVKRKDLTELMLRTGELLSDVGSVLCGEEAVELGLIGSTGGLSDALDSLYEMIKSSKEGQDP